MVKKRLSFEDFNDEIIVHNILSKKLPLVTFEDLFNILGVSKGI